MTELSTGGTVAAENSEFMPKKLGMRSTDLKFEQIVQQVATLFLTVLFSIIIVAVTPPGLSHL